MCKAPSKPHLEKAHEFWATHLKPSDWVIDATCGNGKDTAILAQLVPQGHVYSIDIQEDAINKAREALDYLNVSFLRQCHTQLPHNQKVKLIVYNLGYLPGGDKKITSMASTTLISAEKALNLLTIGGALSITCYPGHPEGAAEQEALQMWSQSLPHDAYLVEWTVWRERSPTLLIIIKIKS
jgi:16S rRNA G1207 methylase RsmC